MTQPQPDPPQPTDLENVDWDSAKFGKMADYATDPEDEPETEPWTPSEDPAVE